MPKRYVIVMHDDEYAAYWTCRYKDTDNYSILKQDATVFKSRVSAFCMMETLNLDETHSIEEI